MKKSEAGRLVAVMLVSFPSQASRINDEQQAKMAEVFAEMLDDLTYEQCNAALRVLIQTRQFMPTVSEIRAVAIDLERGPMASGGDQWGNVTRAMREKGAWRSPGIDFVFSDPVTARVVQQMHWPTLCLSENQIADRARFIELYDKLANDARREIQAPALAAARAARELSAPSDDVGKLIALVAGSVARGLEP